MRTIANRALTVLRMALFTGLVVWPLLSQAQPFNGEIPDSTVVAFDRFGHPMRLGDMRVPEAPITYLMGGGTNSCTAGWFNLVFTDNGNGFNDPVNGAIYRDIACRVFSDLSVLIQPANDPYTGLPPIPGFVNIELRLPTNPAPGAVGFGSAAHGAINRSPTTPDPLQNRTVDGEIWKTINGGYDSWIGQLAAIPSLYGQNAFFHGFIHIDFNQFPSTSWHLDPSSPPGAPLLDLHTVIFHEALHGLGISSFLDATGVGLFGVNYYSRWDDFLFSGGSPLMNNQWQCNALSYSGGALANNCGVVFSGPIATEPVHSPNPFTGSSLDHLDGDCPSGLNYLMHPGPIANQSRIPLQAEASVLCDLGYRTSNSIGTDPTWVGTVVNNYASCGSRLAGVDDVFQYNTTNNHVYFQGQGTALVIDDFLSNDEDQAKPNTMANEFDPCVEILHGGGTVNILSATSIDYTPAPGFIGWAVIRYLPINTFLGTHGNYTHIFVFVKPPDLCDQMDCNLILGGDFEQLNDPICFPYSNWRISNTNTPDHMWFNGAQWVSGLGSPTYISFCTQTGMVPVVPSHNGAPLNQHYVSLVGNGLPGNQEGVLFELCSPLIPGEEYILEYWARMQTTPCNVQLDFRAFEQQPCTPAMGATDLTGGSMTCFGTPFTAISFVPGPSNVASDWTNYQVQFTFPPGVSGNFIAAYMVAISGVGDVFLDDVSIHPVINVTGIVTDACTGQNDGAIDISVHGGSGNYTYLWSTTDITEDIAGLASGTYFVTVTDELGCSQMESFVVADLGPCADPFTITKTVLPSPTYALAPLQFVIEVCNTTAGDELVDITEYFPPNFVITGSNPVLPWVTPTTTLSQTILANSCETYQITGYFTQFGSFVNTVALDHAGTSTHIEADAPIEILVGCPMYVNGSGACTPGGSVELCLGMHTQMANVSAVSLFFVYPNYLVAPPAGPLGSSISSVFPISSATIGTPTTVAGGWPPNHLAVEVIVNFSSLVNPSPPYVFFCIDFTIGAGGVPAGINSDYVWASTSATDTYLAGWNQTNVVTDGVATPFWTQAFPILYNDCPDVVTQDASFTIEHPSCGGEVTVSANFTDPNAVHSWIWGDDRTTPVNGAVTYTYDYFSTITDNQGWPVNIPPAPPGTYTITHTVILNGVASISTQDITIYECCAADQPITDGKHSSTYGSGLAGITIDIQGQFIIDQDFTFNNATVYMEPGAEIIVNDGVNLNVFNSTISSCQDVLYKGITTGNGCIVQVKNSVISDAESSIKGMNSSIIVISSSEFHNNRLAIEVPLQGGYNSVAIDVTGTTFHAEGPLKQPYPGQTTVVGQTGYAAFDVWDMSLDLTSTGNVIHDMSNGIVGHRSNMHILEFTIRDIQPDIAYDGVGNGSGIYSNGKKAFNYLKQAGFGQTGAPSFENCYWGIYTEYMNVRSVENNMLNVGTAYRVDRSGYMDVDILNNTLDTRRDGIVLNMNDGAAHILVESNNILFARNPPVGQYTKGYVGIRVNEANTLNPNSIIRNNVITFRPGVTTAHAGILITAAKKYLLANNVMHMNDNSTNYAGIYLRGCESAEVSCNEVNGSTQGYLHLGQAGIRNWMGQDPLISCNEVNNTTNGLLFSGWASGTDLRGNIINNHRWGLHLEFNAIIETQAHKGNLWLGTYPVNGYGAWYEDALKAITYPFKYDATSPNTVPPSQEPSDWFQQLSGNTYACNTGLNYCDQFGERCTTCPREVFDKIVEETVTNNQYTDETLWIMKGDLYRLLGEDPSVMANDQDLADFYTNMEGGVIAQLKELDNEQLVLFEIDATVLTQVQQNRDQLEVILGQVKVLMGDLSDPGLTGAQRVTLLGNLAGLQQTMQTLSQYNSTALDLASNSRALTAASVKATNANIGASEQIETNHKQVNEIYLSTVAKDIDSFTSTEEVTLFSIANQCPLVGGNAVFRARALYALIDSEQDFDDPALCLQHGLITKSLEPKQENTISIIPNPANSLATLILSAPLEQQGKLVFYNSIGAEIMTVRIPVDVERFTFETSGLAPGMYHYVVHGAVEHLGDGKLSVTR